MVLDDEYFSCCRGCCSRIHRAGDAFGFERETRNRGTINTKHNRESESVMSEYFRGRRRSVRDMQNHQRSNDEREQEHEQRLEVLVINLTSMDDDYKEELSVSPTYADSLDGRSDSGRMQSKLPPVLHSKWKQQQQQQDDNFPLNTIVKGRRCTPLRQRFQSPARREPQSQRRDSMRGHVASKAAPTVQITRGLEKRIMREEEEEETKSAVDSHITLTPLHRSIKNSAMRRRSTGMSSNNRSFPSITHPKAFRSCLKDVTIRSVVNSNKSTQNSIRIDERYNSYRHHRMIPESPRRECMGSTSIGSEKFTVRAKRGQSVLSSLCSSSTVITTRRRRGSTRMTASRHGRKQVRILDEKFNSYHDPNFESHTDEECLSMWYSRNEMRQMKKNRRNTVEDEFMQKIAGQTLRTAFKAILHCQHDPNGKSWQKTRSTLIDFTSSCLKAHCCAGLELTLLHSVCDDMRVQRRRHRVKAKELDPTSIFSSLGRAKELRDLSRPSRIFARIVGCAQQQEAAQKHFGTLTKTFHYI